MYAAKTSEEAENESHPPRLSPSRWIALIDYVAQEQAAARAEYDELMALPVDDRVRRGYTLTGLRVDGAGREPGQVWLEIGEQLSRSLRGDEVLLIAEDAPPALLAGTATNGVKISAQVLEVHSGRLLVQPARALDAGRTWRMEPAYTNHAAVVAKALTCIDAYHGQHLLDALNGVPPAGEDEGVSDPEGLLAELEAESGVTLDSDQRAAFCAAVRTPALWGLQGPPGTGKTRVAAFVAEGLARSLLHRVMVVSQSHEAVNRLLNEISGLFPQRKLVKVGAALRPTPDAAIQRLTPQAYKQEEKRLLRSRPILGMTLHTALLMADIHSFRADVVIVDEASQVPLAYGAALGLLGFSVLLFGDPAQLNAIVPAVLEESPLACSIWSAVPPSRVWLFCQSHTVSTHHWPSWSAACSIRMQKGGPVSYPARVSANGGFVFHQERRHLGRGRARPTGACSMGAHRGTGAAAVVTSRGAAGGQAREAAAGRWHQGPRHRRGHTLPAAGAAAGGAVERLVAASAGWHGGDHAGAVGRGRNRVAGELGSGISQHDC